MFDRILFAGLIASVATPGLACSPDQKFLSCRIDGRTARVEVCTEGPWAIYRYGADLERPELELRAQGADWGYRPWLGVGRSIWEEASFFNGGYEYRVFGSLDKMVAEEDPDRLTGGVEVYQGERLIASLDCAPGEISYPWSEALSNAKEAAGFTWSHEARAWVRGD